MKRKPLKSPILVLMVWEVQFLVLKEENGFLITFEVESVL